MYKKQNRRASLLWRMRIEIEFATHVIFDNIGAIFMTKNIAGNGWSNNVDL